MIYTITFCITLLCLAAFFAVTAGWLSISLVFIAGVGTIASLVAVVAIIAGK